MTLPKRTSNEEAEEDADGDSDGDADGGVVDLEHVGAMKGYIADGDSDGDAGGGVVDLEDVGRHERVHYRCSSSSMTRLKINLSLTVSFPIQSSLSSLFFSILPVAPTSQSLPLRCATTSSSC